MDACELRPLGSQLGFPVNNTNPQVINKSQTCSSQWLTGIDRVIHSFHSG